MSLVMDEEPENPPAIRPAWEDKSSSGVEAAAGDKEFPPADGDGGISYQVHGLPGDNVDLTGAVFSPGLSEFGSFALAMTDACLEESLFRLTGWPRVIGMRVSSFLLRDEPVWGCGMPKT